MIMLAVIRTRLFLLPTLLTSALFLAIGLPFPVPEQSSGNSCLALVLWKKEMRKVSHGQSEETHSLIT